MSRQGVPRRSSALCAIAASAKPRLNSYMAREPNGPSDRAARTTLKRPERPEQDEPARPKGQTRPIEERFLLRVDGQMKSSFSSKETAVTAGAKIKKAYPIVVVTIVDTEKHTDVPATLRARAEKWSNEADRVRFRHLADIPYVAFDVAFGGKADMTFCGANVCFLTQSGHRTGVVHRWDAAVASVCIKRDLDVRSGLSRLSGSFAQCSEQIPGEYQYRRAFAESSSPEALLGLHHCTRS
jgi:hypothetical protein